MKINKKIILSIICVYVVFVLCEQQVTLNHLNADRVNITKNIQMVKKDNDNIGKMLDYTKSSQYIEKVARDDLGLVKKGETIYINVNGK